MGTIEMVKGIRNIDAGDFSVVIVKEHENRVIGRLEVDGYVYHIGRGTPSRRSVKEALSKAYSKDAGLIVIRRLESEYGWGRSRLEVHMYDSRETLFKYEPRYILRRDGIVEEERKEEG